MFWTSIPDDERLHLWKKLRDDIKHLSLDEKLDEIAKFCSSMPYGARSLDYYNPSDWPSPWEIIYHSILCTSSISLLIYYTVDLLEDRPVVELYLVEDSEDRYLLPVVDNQFVLNYELGKVNKLASINDNFTVLQIFTKDQIKAIY